MHVIQQQMVEFPLFRDKLAYSENQASKNLKLYRVKQKEVPLTWKAWKYFSTAPLLGGAGTGQGGGVGGRLGDGEEGKGGEKEKEGAGEECLKSRERWRGKQGQNPCVCHAWSFGKEFLFPNSQEVGDPDYQSAFFQERQRSCQSIYAPICAPTVSSLVFCFYLIWLFIMTI